MNDICTCTDDCALGFNPACSCDSDECDCSNISNMIGTKKAAVFSALTEYIDDHYEMDKVWKRQKIKTKKWKYEYKYTKGSKTFCGFYITDNCLGFMVILGQKERTKVEEARAEYSKEFFEIYDATETYHDGKWVMLELEDTLLLEDIKKLLLVKKKPNKKD